MSIPRVSIVMPCRNEEAYIESAVRSVLAQEAVEGGIEVLVADGRSTDATLEILEKLSQEDGRLRVIDNPGKIVPTGLNAAIEDACGEIIVRMDAHTEYAKDYVRRCVEVLEASGADNVGGPWNADGRDYIQSAIALAFRSPFSSGGAGSHDVGFEGEVDSVYLGCWRKKYLIELGMFDEEFVRNQDDELNLRLVRNGGRIWQSPAIRSWYYPRNSILALFRQYKQYGYWKVRVIQKHRIPAAVRHLVPGGFVGIVGLLAFLAFFSPEAAIGLFVLLGVYFSGTVLASLLCCGKEKRWDLLPVMPMVFFAYHFGYGSGFLRGVLDFLVLRRGVSDSFTKLTRVSGK